MRISSTLKLYSVAFLAGMPFNKDAETESSTRFTGGFRSAFGLLIPSVSLDAFAIEDNAEVDCDFLCLCGSDMVRARKWSVQGEKKPAAWKVWDNLTCTPITLNASPGPNCLGK